MSATQSVYSAEPLSTAAAPLRGPSRRLRILVLTGSYAPDRTGMAPLNAELCEYLAGRGHEVSVATCFPHYPEWKFPEAYRRKLWQRETRAGVTLYRTRVVLPARRTTLRRILYDTTVGLATALGALPVRGPDVVLALSPPLQAALAGCLLSRLKRAPLMLQIQDLVPDLAVALGMLRNAAAIRLARALERYVYGRAGTILVLCAGFRANLEAKGVPREKIHVVSDWVDTRFICPEAPPGSFRSRHNLRDSSFLVLHAGNMGAKQNLENLLEAAALLGAREEIQFCLVGDGAEKERLEEFARHKALANVRFLPLEPRESLPEMLSAADALVLNQSAKVVDMVIPSKLLTYMAAGRAVVAAVSPRSEAADCIARSGCGLVVPPANPAALAEAILCLATDRALGARLGRQGRRHAEKHFARENVLEQWESHLLRFAAPDEKASRGALP